MSGIRLEIAGLVAYLLVLAYLGFRPRQGFASWHMFAGSLQATYNLRSASSGDPFNPWDHLPHTRIANSISDVRLLLLYVSKVHRLTDLRGTVDLREGLICRTVVVENSRVVD